MKAKKNRPSGEGVEQSGVIAEYLPDIFWDIKCSFISKKRHKYLLMWNLIIIFEENVSY